MYGRYRRPRSSGPSTSEMDAPPSKRARRAAATAATAALEGIDVAVADLGSSVHPTQTIALTSEDGLEAGGSDVYRGAATTVVTLHTNERPKRLPAGTIHIAGAFDDNSNFDDDVLFRHLNEMAAKVWAANTPRVIFVCQAGVNRSSLALCYYAARHGSCSWQQDRGRCKKI